MKLLTLISDKYPDPMIMMMMMMMIDDDDDNDNDDDDDDDDDENDENDDNDDNDDMMTMMMTYPHNIVSVVTDIIISLFVPLIRPNQQLPTY